MPADDIDAAVRLHDEGMAARAEGDYARALRLGLEALGMLERLEGAAHPDVANVLNHIGGAHVDCGDYAEAERAYRRAVAIMEPLGGEPDLDCIRVQALTNLGSLHRMRGNYGAAEPVLRRALQEAEKCFGADSVDVSTVLNDLGVLYKYMNRFAKAERCYQRALGILEGRAEGDVSLLNSMATIYHNLGGLEHERGRFARGEPFARKSMEIRRRAVGEDHPALAADMAALAGLLDAQGKFDEAEALYGQALEVFRRVYGEEHYELAVTFNNLAAIADSKGNSAEAERLYQQSLAIKEKVLGALHPDLAMTLNNLAMTYAGAWRFAEAEPLFTRALKILDEALGPKHPRTKACRQNYHDMQREKIEHFSQLS